jgi:molybdopterin molybdotransferase
MITFKEASEIIRSIKPNATTERISLHQTLRRVLAENIITDIDIPAFDRSAMDGFACRKADLENNLKVIGEIPAGTDPVQVIGDNECMRIMTGGKVPSGADYIMKKEDAEEIEEGLVKCRNLSSITNIRMKGEDLKKGGLVLPAGSLIRPQHIAMLASCGWMNPLVFCKPDVAIISTGNELVDPADHPGPAQIRDSNGFQLAAQASKIGINPVYLGIARDEKKAIATLLSGALSSYRITLISGGVSVGDHDHVPEVLRELDVRMLFHRLKVKPGQHLLFGIKDDHYVFGFPGNPLSSFVQFEIMVKPFIMRCMSYELKNESVLMPMAEDYNQASTQLINFLPVVIDKEGTVRTINYHGSAHIHAYLQADGIMEIPAGTSTLKRGEKVYVRPL